MVLLIATKVSPDFEDVVNDELHEYYGLEWSKHHRFTMIKLFNYMKVTSDTATESWAWLPQHQRRSPNVWFAYSIWAGQIAMEIKMNMSLPTAMKCANWSRIFKHTWIHKMGTTLHWRRRDTSLGSCLSSVRYITSQRSILHHKYITSQRNILHRGRRSSDELKFLGWTGFIVIETTHWA